MTKMSHRRFLLTLMLVSGIGLTARAQVLATDTLATDDARIDSLYRTLPEVLVTGERPVVKAGAGKLVYDLPRLIQDRPVDNAYDALKELPGIVEMGGALTLSGQSVTVMLDGKASTLSAEQLATLLHSIPASRIEQAEVMYNAPARYQVRGALVNIVLKQTDGKRATLQGEVYGQYEQQHEASFTERATLLYGNSHFSFDFLYAHSHGQHYSTTDKEARHTLADGTLHPIQTHEEAEGRSHSHDFRLGADYNLAKEHRLSFVYTGKYNTAHRKATATGTLQSTVLHDSPDWLHNGRLDYTTPIGLKAGAELTYYRSPSTQSLHSLLEGTELDFSAEDCQRINRWKFFLAGEHRLGHEWSLNYGAVYTTSVDHSYQRYTHTESEKQNGQTSLPADMVSRRKEQTLNLYAGFSKSFGDKLSMDASLAAEHYKTSVWDRWDWYPTLNLTYLPANGHVLQLELSSDKDYPNYWAVQDAVSYLSSYSEIQGNPLLHPSRSYQLQLTYVLRGKYIFTSWFSHTGDYSTQTLYQSPDRLVEIYKYQNFDYQRQAGIQTSIPFGIDRLLNSRLTLIGVWHHEKDNDFWTLPFDRRICYGIAVLNNTFTLSTRPDLKLTVAGMVRSKAIQGIYDLPSSGYVNLGLRYAFANGKAILNLYGNDLFETGQISPRIRFGTQWVTNRYSCFRELGLSFTYKFGGYKEKKREKVDTSRFK